jgi:hypothetical protein
MSSRVKLLTHPPGHCLAILSVESHLVANLENMGKGNELLKLVTEVNVVS